MTTSSVSCSESEQLLIRTQNHGLVRLVPGDIIEFPTTKGLRQVVAGAAAGPVSTGLYKILRILETRFFSRAEPVIAVEIQRLHEDGKRLVSAAHLRNHLRRVCGQIGEPANPNVAFRGRREP